MAPSRKKSKLDFEDQYAIAEFNLVELSMLEAAMSMYKTYMQKMGMSTVKSGLLIHKIELLIEIAKK